MKLKEIIDSIKKWYPESHSFTKRNILEFLEKLKEIKQFWDEK